MERGLAVLFCLLLFGFFVMSSNKAGISTVWSVNEWGRLREVIIGNPRGAFLPSLDDVSQISFDRPTDRLASLAVAQRMPPRVVEETLEDIADLAQLLTNHGVMVHHADSLDSSVPIDTPDWHVEQESSINIRDITLIHGSLVIDAPSPTRGRYFETFAVRRLFDVYHRGTERGCSLAPPRPRLLDGTYNLSRPRGISDDEPLFDAANCVRLGRDVIIDINNTANLAGARWLQWVFNLHFGRGTITVHPVSLSPDHLDVIIVPLCEGVALINPHYVSSGNIPDCIRDWDLIPAPAMQSQQYASPTPKASNWIGLNVLVIDGKERTVIVERRQTELVRTLERHRFHPLPMSWRHGRTWGGAFHCVTLDVHRDGEL